MIRFTLDFKGKTTDIQLDEKQSIINLIGVLKESGVISDKDEWSYCKSVLQRRVISVYKTFEEERIFTGDILRFE